MRTVDNTEILKFPGAGMILVMPAPHLLSGLVLFSAPTIDIEPQF